MTDGYWAEDDIEDEELAEDMHLAGREAFTGMEEFGFVLTPSEEVLAALLVTTDD